MWNKIYLAALVASVAVMGFFTVYSWSWLQSIGQPQAAVEGFTFHDGIAGIALWVTAALLLVIANGVLWLTHKAWAMWSTFIYASIFVGIQYFWLGEAFFRYKKTNLTYDGSFSLGPVMGVVLIFVCGVIVFANHLISIRLYRKIYPATVAEPPLIDTEPVEE